MHEEITDRLKSHYQKKFSEFGATSKGVDWGKEEDVTLRHQMMYNLILNNYYSKGGNSSVTLLDVGCGYGAFYEFLKQRGADIKYTGFDLVPEMIAYGKDTYSDADFFCQDFMKADNVMFDYVVCNGILTQKLAASIIEMDQFANRLITKMFSVAREGIAFNIMSSKVNFMVDNLYYRHPADVLTYCLNELTTKVKIEHSYPLFEYTVYAYKV